MRSSRRRHRSSGEAAGARTTWPRVAVPTWRRPVQPSTRWSVRSDSASPRLDVPMTTIGEVPPPRRGVRLGVDVGDVRIGVATCDPGALLATPLETVSRGPGDVARLLALAEELDAFEVVVGLPRSLSGGIGPAPRRRRRSQRNCAQPRRLVVAACGSGWLTSVSPQSVRSACFVSVVGKGLDSVLLSTKPQLWSSSSTRLTASGRRGDHQGRKWASLRE